MAKFNDLIKTDPNVAAGILLNSGIHVVNNLIPNIQVTKEEYKQLVQIILAGEAKDPDEVEEEGDGTEDPEDPSKDPVTGGDTEQGNETE